MNGSGDDASTAAATSPANKGSSSSVPNLSEEDVVDGIGPFSPPIPAPIKKILGKGPSRSRHGSGQSTSSTETGGSRSRISMTPDRENVPTCEGDMFSFIVAVSNRYTKKSDIRRALEQSWVGMDTNKRVGEDGNSILHLAAKTGRVKMVKALAEMIGDKKRATAHENGNGHHLNGSEVSSLDHPDNLDGGEKNDLKVDSLNREHSSALHLAVEQDEHEVVAALLKAGADVECLNGLGLTPVQVACLKGSNKSLPNLLNGGANLNVAWKKATVLHLACFSLSKKLRDMEESRTDRVQTERDSNQDDVNHQKLGEELALRERALKQETFVSLRTLLKRFTTSDHDLLPLIRAGDHEGSIGPPVLHHFAEFDFADGIRDLLQPRPSPVDPDAVDDAGNTALIVALKQNSLAAAEVLLRHGANPNCTEAKKKLTPLHILLDQFNLSRKDESLKLIEELLSNHGADPKAKDLSGEAPVHALSRTYDFDVISKFIQYLGDTAAELLAYQDADGMTLLHYATGRLDERAIYELIIKGGKPMHKITPLESPKKEQQRIDCRFQIRGLPLQEAIKNDNCNEYFNAIQRLDLENLAGELQWTEGEVDEFLCTHLIAASRYARQDVIRNLFMFFDRKCSSSSASAAAVIRRLHHILLFCDDSEGTAMDTFEVKQRTKVFPEELFTFTKNPLEWAIQNDDRHSVTEILHQEKRCHDVDRDGGLRCLKRQLKGGDEILKWAIESFSLLYGMTIFQRHVKPWFCLLPLLFSLAMFGFDISSDVQLTRTYYQKGWKQNLEAVASSNATRSGANELSDLVRDGDPVGDGPTESFKSFPSARDYQYAFCMNLVCIVLPFFVIWTMCYRELKIKFLKDNRRNPSEKKPWDNEIHYLKLAGIFLLCIPTTPFFLPYMAFNRMWYKFKHMRSDRKNEHRADLEKSEYMWGVVRMAEAGFESAPQLLLQLWLFSFHFCTLSERGLGSVGSYVDQIFSGFTSFATLGRQEADDTEKGLAKIFVSFVSLVLTVSSSYKTLKRGSVRYSNLVLLYCSNLLQLFARMLSLALFLTVARQFWWAILVPLCCHFAVVGLIKWFLDPTRFASGKFRKLITIVNILSSSLINVRIKPLREDRDLLDLANSKKAPDDDDAEKGTPVVNPNHNGGMGEAIPLQQRRRPSDESGIGGTPPYERNLSRESYRSAVVEDKTAPSHETFVTQAAFFALQFVENVAMCLTPFLDPSENRTLECVGSQFPQAALVSVFILSLGSWLCQWVYYGCWGHPWSDINGPRGRPRIEVTFHCLGEQRTFTSSKECCTCCCGEKGQLMEEEQQRSLSPLPRAEEGSS